jgi:hypothetical protein
MSRTNLAVFVLALALAGPAKAKELEVHARASVSAAGDPGAVRAMATREARRRAVVTAIEKVLGPDAAVDPRVSAKIDAIVAQIPDDRFVEATGTRVGASYEMAITLVLDDKDFRTLLSDAGVAVHTATARSHAILAVMDEFLATPRDLRAPLEELEEFNASKGASYEEKNASRSASAASSSRAEASMTTVDATASSRARLDAKRGGNDPANLSGRASADMNVKAAQASASATTRASSSSASASSSVAASAHDDVHYRKLIRYQPQNAGPEKTSQTYAALMGQLQDYDLRVLDNELFRSQYFKDTPLTLDQLQNGAELAKYVKFARADAAADFFMVGTSVLVDAGKNPNTGDMECTGIVTVRTYATSDGESIASETFSEASSGRNTNECSANLARKLGQISGPVVGARIQEYWKRRSTYGREMLLTLKGASLPLMVRTGFARSLKTVPGVEGSTQRACSDKECQFVVTYKGSDPLDQAVAVALSENPAFASLDSRLDGTNVVLCMGPCATVEAGGAK